MSNITIDQVVMASMMKPGVRVRRAGDLDGNSPGTVVQNWPGGVCRVKWDNTGEYQYLHKFLEGKYQLAIINFVKPIPSFVKPVPTLASKLFSGKKFSDFKIICDGKTIDCHKTVLGTQSDVFETMFLNIDLNEAKSGEVKIEDFDFDTVETLIYFLYDEEIQDKKLINTKLLYAADKYNVPGLMEMCATFLKCNLFVENALDVLVASHHTNQQDLFKAAANFVCENKGQLANTGAWEEMIKTNPTLVATVFSKVLLGVPSLTPTKSKTPKRTLKGGVQLEDLKVGNGPEATGKKMIGVYYEGKLMSNNRVFDSCLRGKPFKFRLGTGEVIKGWEVGIEGMKVGGKRRLRIPPAMAYGAKGAPPDIPANSHLIFEVECKAVN